ncbi:ATP-binding protein [Halolamina litorea]|uniref:ATP-binding protein n=1 Tax=Halolamina litorea TaxID=1515593 RepID=A0ABD6BNX6_9EURY|nr:ATPase [Halolamina litorea]
MHVVGRQTRESTAKGEAPPTGRLGRYLARDDSTGAPVGIDLDHPHAGLVVGKRGAGKSHTLGVLAEAAARARGVAPVVVDPIGAFGGLTADAGGGRNGDGTEPVPARVVERPTIRADAIPATDWPELVGLDPESGPGALVWDAASSAPTLSGMLQQVESLEAPREHQRAARNHLGRARDWDVFDQDGLTASELFGPEATVLSLAGADDAATSAVVAAVARLLYDARTGDEGDRPPRLPWLFVDEAHVAVDGVAGAALRTLLTRGRTPGVSLLLATQRPSALPAVAASQADLLVAHRLTSGADIDALAAASPTYLTGTLRERLPSGQGEALIVDDATESTHSVRIRERHTPHGGHTPRASGLTASPPDAGRETDRCVGPNEDV